MAAPRGRRLRVRLRPLERRSSSTTRSGSSPTTHPSSPLLRPHVPDLDEVLSRARGEYQSSPIFESHSDDGGKHWTKAQEISGSNAALCTFQASGPAGQCDENQFSVPTVGPDGTVYVAFQNEQNKALWEPGEVFDDQYLLVKSTDGGGTWSSPTFVVGLEDGSADYPLNVDGRQTLTGYQLRVNSAGNIVASPRASENGKLVPRLRDNRNGTHDSASPVTNTDVFLMTSSNGGSTWSGTDAGRLGPGDQWFPWVDVNPTNGTIGVALQRPRGREPGALQRRPDARYARARRRSSARRRRTRRSHGSSGRA